MLKTIEQTQKLSLRSTFTTITANPTPQQTPRTGSANTKSQLNPQTNEASHENVFKKATAYFHEVFEVNSNG